MTDDPTPILVLALPRWSGDYMKPAVALSRELARTAPVLYVEHPHTLSTHVRHLVRRHSSPPSWSAHLRRESTRDGDPVHVLTPPTVWPMNALPASLYDVVLRRNAHRVAASVRRTLDTLDVDAPLVLNALNPHYGVALAGAFDEVGRVYFCYDEIRARDWNARHGGRMEDRYLNMVDAVVGTSPALHERLREHHPNAHLVPNGVDFALFHRAVTDDEPRDVGDPATPCVGYVGSLDERVDYPLLEQLIGAHPDWQFRFVGRVMVPAAEALARHESVALTGAQPPERLPSELRRMDVGLMPFVRDAFTRNMYPCKVNEYLAAGLPVVSTEFADLPDVADLVTFASTPTAFQAATEAVLAKAHEPGAPDRRQQRIDRARSNRWRHRAEQLRDVLETVRRSPDTASSPPVSG